MGGLIERGAGIGKTALLAVAAGLAGERGMRPLSARCAWLERAHVFGAVRQLFAPALRDRTSDTRNGLFAGAAELAAPVLLEDATETAARASDSGASSIRSPSRPPRRIASAQVCTRSSSSTSEPIATPRSLPPAAR